MNNKLPEVTQRVESLLRAAKNYEPDGGAPPEGLFARSLVGHRYRVEARRRARRGLTLAGGIAAAVAACLFYWGGDSASKSSSQVAQVAVPATPLPVKVTAPPERIALPPTLSATPAVKPSRRRSVSPAHPSRRLRDTTRQNPIRRNSPEHRAPEVQWEVQTVRRDTYGVLAPAWVTQADESGREVDITPVVVDIPVHTEEHVVVGASAGNSDSAHPVLYDSEENQ